MDPGTVPEGPAPGTSNLPGVGIALAERVALGEIPPLGKAGGVPSVRPVRTVGDGIYIKTYL